MMIMKLKKKFFNPNRGEWRHQEFQGGAKRLLNKNLIKLNSFSLNQYLYQEIYTKI